MYGFHVPCFHASLPYGGEAGEDSMTFKRVTWGLKPQALIMTNQFLYNKKT